MDHNDVQEHFLDYLEDGLSDSLREAFQTHLGACEDCRNRFERYQQLISLEQGIAGEQAAAGSDFSVKVMDRIESSEVSLIEVILRRFNMGKRVLVPGATLAVVVLAIIIGKSQVDNMREIRSFDLVSAPLGENRSVKSDLSVVEKSVAEARSGGVESEEAEVGRQLAERKFGVEERLKGGTGTGRVSPQVYSAPREPLIPESRPLKAPARKAAERFLALKSSKAGGQGSGVLGRRVDRASGTAAVKPKQVFAPKDQAGQKEAYQDLITAFESEVEEAKSRDSRESTSGTPWVYRESQMKTERKKVLLAKSAAGEQEPSSLLSAGLSEAASQIRVGGKDHDGVMTTGDGRQFVLRAGRWYPADRKPDAQGDPVPGGEVYGEYDENPRVLVSQDPRSTFSLDVDTGSYANIRRFLRMGRKPPKNSVRIEELVNYFHYKYPTEDDKPFGVNYEIAPMPLSSGRYLLKLGVRARESSLHDELGWNLVFLIDVSGSMDTASKLPLLKRSLPLLVEKMSARDRIAVVTYSDSARLVLEPTTGSDKERILSVIRGLRAGGRTNGSGGINLAYDLAKKHYQPSGVNRVILATDGDFNVGVSSFDGLLKLIKDKRESGITLSVLGLGQGNLKEKTMEQLANRGNGNYSYVDSFREARKVLADELAANVQVVAKDVKVQIEFNPEQVLEYRLIGYDNRKLAHQDFANDRVDAGEVGSGHTVSVLYELILKGTPLAEKLGTKLRYQIDQKRSVEQVPEQLAGELAFVKIRYKEPAGSLSSELSYPLVRSELKENVEQTSSDFRFAAAVSAFGHLLRGSKYLENYSYEDVAKLARGAMGEDLRGHRHEFLSLVENAASIQ